MKENEGDVVEWKFVEWNGINKRNGEERVSKMTKNGCKMLHDDRTV